MAVYCPGWASSSVWDWSGMDDDTPLFSDVVDKQLAGIQASIEDFHATHRTSTVQTDQIESSARGTPYTTFDAKSWRTASSPYGPGYCDTSSGSSTTRATGPRLTA